MVYTHLKKITNLSLAIHEISIHLSVVDHPTIVQIIDISFDENGGQITMSKAQDNLYNYMFSAPKPSIEIYLDRIGRAVDYLHQHNVIHRDIKADNILLIDGLPYLSDFGISIYLGDKCHYSMCSAIKYRAPEAIQQLKIKDPIAIDMWALGVLFLEIIIWSNKLFSQPLGEAAIIIDESDILKFVRSTYPIDEIYHPLLAGLLTINPKNRRAWYGDDGKIDQVQLYSPTEPIIQKIVDELSLPDYIFTQPVNDIPTLWVLSSCHDIYLSDKYCAAKMDGNLYDGVLNVARDVFRPRKGSINPSPG